MSGLSASNCVLSRIPPITLDAAEGFSFREFKSEVEKAFERCVLNLVFNNRDDHAKNASFRMNRDFQWKLAPCYDLTYCSGLVGEHQMTIMGEGRASQVIDRMTTVAVGFKKWVKNHPVRSASVKTINHATRLILAGWGKKTLPHPTRKTLSAVAHQPVQQKNPAPTH